MSEQRLKSTISATERRHVKSMSYALVPIDRGFGELNTWCSRQFARSIACSIERRGKLPLETCIVDRLHINVVEDLSIKLFHKMRPTSSKAAHVPLPQEISKDRYTCTWGAIYHVFKNRRPPAKVRSERLQELAAFLSSCFKERRSAKLRCRICEFLNTKQGT